MDMDYKATANVFKAFCDVNRLQILTLLRKEELCAYQLQEVLEIGQSTLSHHMKVLCESGVVVSRRAGKWTYYHIDEQGSRRAEALLKLLTVSKSIEA